MATNQELIDSIDAQIAGNPQGIKSYEINGRRIDRMTPAELFDLRSRLAAIEARKNAGGMFSGVRMGRPRR